MKLRRSQVRTSKRTGEPFYRYLISPPPEVIEELGWEPGDELECAVRSGELVVRRAETRENGPRPDTSRQ